MFALNGEPGVYSARYAGLDKSDDANIDKLLANLENESDRRAQFVCVISMSAPGEETKTFKGTVSGEITHTRQGNHGFGYDPIFYLPEYQCYSAELSLEEKNKLSHRGKALRLMKERLHESFNCQ